jgi:hypothetical protein
MKGPVPGQPEGYANHVKVSARTWEKLVARLFALALRTARFYAFSRAISQAALAP